MSKSAPIPCVGVVVLRGDQVLLVKRKNPPNAGAWSIPGGRIEAGESQEQAVHRELNEETGIDAEIIGKITVIDAQFGSYHYLLHDYAAVWTKGEPVAADDALDARFVPLNALSQYDLWDQTLEVIAQAVLMKSDH